MLARFRQRCRLWRSKLRSRARRAGLGPFAKAILTETKNGKLLVRPADAAVGWQLDHFGVYEQDELKFLLSRIDADSRVCVVGAHVGAMVVPLARECRELLAFEANPDTAELLKMNLLLNDLSGVEVCESAVGEKEGTIEFFSNTVNSGGSKRKPLRDVADFTFDQPATITVPMTTLAMALPEGRWDLMVMDIEGSEYFALKGAGGRLADVGELHIEYDPRHLHHVSGIDNAEFLSLLEPHFTRVAVAPESDFVSIDAMREILNGYWESGAAVNLLFAK